jgi:hypothetical protein
LPQNLLEPVLVVELALELQRSLVFADRLLGLVLPQLLDVALERAEARPTRARAERGEPPGQRGGHTEHGRDDRPVIARSFSIDPLGPQRCLAHGELLYAATEFHEKHGPGDSLAR